MSHWSTEAGDDVADFVQARFPVDLNFADGDARCLEEASRAIRREYRDAAKWKRLRCRDVKSVSESQTGTVYELSVGHAVEFDWSWEGAVAFRPLTLKEFEQDEATFFLNGSLDPDVNDSIVWSGEVLEVDEATGRMFVLVADPEHRPRRGTFYVRPFEFLACLDSLYNEPSFVDVRERLPSRLTASEGGIGTLVADPKNEGLPQLQHWWRHSWSILWGPPGTGKTYTTGQQVAALLDDPNERILVVSTTNKATDAVAESIGRGAVARGVDIETGNLRRIGKGASFRRFELNQLTGMLRGTEAEYLARIEELSLQLVASQSSEEKAMLRRSLKESRQAMGDAAKQNFLDESVQVVVATSFKATRMLACDEVQEDLASDLAPFTTVIIDEAGLISRVAIAALSLLASRRVVLVGDSKQLAPISRISRLLEPSQGKWLASSGLGHLDDFDEKSPSVYALREQRRMHREIGSVVSQYQYSDSLTTAPDVDDREYSMPRVLEAVPRAVWYVLDDDTNDLPAIRAARGVGNRSWIRPGTFRVLDKLFSEPEFQRAHGLFISPFKAQAKEVDSYLARHGYASWTASTVHSQQGSEADIVVFDTVNAGSTAWPYDEWKRLVNVGLSRAREFLLVLASRAEMESPFLRPLQRSLHPAVLRRRSSGLRWENVDRHAGVGISKGTASLVASSKESYRVGNQIESRKLLRPVLSQEQERLCGLELDGKPRLVRGVAGSGKTVVLANWLTKSVKRLANNDQVRIWAVFANRSLQSLIAESILAAWEEEHSAASFPWDRVELYHVKEILAVLLPEAGLSLGSYGFDYDRAAGDFLERKPATEIAPRCDALFIDEAQDMGPHMLKLLSALVQQSDAEDTNSRSVNIFYDNAQNIYGRSTPTWSELGLDMRGRSTVMKESFRSTRPITELALNVLYRLQPQDSHPDHKELVRRGLIEKTLRGDEEWWQVRFNQVDGPNPELRRFRSLDEEFQAIGEYCRELIADQGVKPSDICLIYNGQNIPKRLQQSLDPLLKPLNVQLSVQKNKPFERSENILLATTSHSFKGYDAEVVIIPAVDQYRANGVGVLANNLYVAMTRARSILTIFAQSMAGDDQKQLYQVLENCLDCLEEHPTIENDATVRDDLIAILDQIGPEHEKWLLEIRSKHGLSQEPLVTKSGEIVAEPVFRFRDGNSGYACFGHVSPSQRVKRRLQEVGYSVIPPGHRE